MKKLLPISILFLLLSCNNDDDSIQKNNTKLPQYIHAKYLLDDNRPDFIDGLLEVSYKNSLPHELKGGLFLMFPNDNQGFNPNTIREFTHSNNEILVTQRNTLNNFISSEQTRFKITGNKIDSSTKFNINNSNKHNTKYFYEKNNLHKTLEYWQNSNDELLVDYGIEKLYYFNTKGNLDSIIEQNVVIRNDLSTHYDTVQFKYKGVEIFENYDNSPNPFKQLFLVDELYKKSLSNNNYRKITEKGYDGKKLVQYTQIEYNYFYKNGNVDLTK